MKGCELLSKNRNGIMLLSLVGIVIIGIIVFGGLDFKGAQNELKVGNAAPEFKLKNLEGEDVSLEDFKGKTVVLNFWATWCGYCDEEMPDFQKLMKENENVVVLAVNVRESKKEALEYIKAGGYEFPVVLDHSGEISDRYMVTGFPTSYFIDGEGKIRGSVFGKMTFPQMIQIIEDIEDK